MSEMDFSTTILTSKSPEDVANFLPHSLQLSSRLIEKSLMVWFSNYAAMITRYNQDLNTLVANGRSFFSGSGGEFGSLDKIWNCVASSVMSQVEVNETLIKVIRKDILAQFSSAFHEDFKYSELLVNSNELLEMKNHLGDDNGAYNWNVKAPAILNNFENYKKFEKDLIFNAFISYLNTLNSKTSNLVHKNENAVNFILKEYHLDSEMRLYTDYMINADVPEAESKAAPPTNIPPPRPQPKHKPSVASSNLESAAGTTPVAEKRKSKLRLKMGSILGRKKKHTSLSHAETIPEDALAVSRPSKLETHVSHGDSRNSVQELYSNTVPQRHSLSRAQSKVTEPAESVAEKAPVNPSPVAPSNGDTSSLAAATQKTPQKFHPAFDAAPLQPSQPALRMNNEGVSSVEDFTPPALVEENDEETDDEGANFVKYSSSEEESDVPIDKNGRRESLLNAHDLGQPPKVETDSDVRSRNTSSGKYSFEYGDESKSISTPQHTPVMPASPEFSADRRVPAIPEKPFDESKPVRISNVMPVIAPGHTKGDFQSATVTRAPPPPPSRKAHPTQHDIRRDSLQNLHSSRDSFVMPNAGDRKSLVSQTTGNSLMRQDQFKHFGASEASIREGLNTSIAEILNATFKDGKVTKAQVFGEVAFNYNSSEPLDSLTVNIPTQFSKFLLNDELMTKHGSEEYSLNLALIAGKTLGGIKYLLDLNLDRVPVLIKQIWKFEPNQASLIIKLSLNAAYSKRIKLENFTISAALDNSVLSISALSKPEGSFNKDLNRITWRYVEPLQLDASSPEIKLIARIMTTGLALESASGTRLRFTISEDAIPNVKIFDSSHQPVPSIASLSSGNYSSHI
ncbi:hypothetical protein METBIDRAFT_30808 [Metschnikowia bicuspidata var. bicuspidata NRRL YB-4993]|uniref:MHD domain-containing protein n=1 Tax=Metschnikowia bicuspidata var. bicuspidata NRRL YB-4993 TaxID=869754 RepID=A0A1A0HCQ5_9ASCO|nr:hypothetical protein METBIDRAFT_30808 [Metschnikowia bicuspidata var. bicuspidata NRRL YB-4993]OBA21781.1 hypothetical protein METBIDRAFT_30808 [Metschnikowia bicuspidata var. bicuspidata NRRL YB-4993]